jgi:hypothetical protein
MRSFLQFTAAVFILASLARADDPLPPRVFSHPERIRYDSQCFTIEGKDTFIFSGAFHYFRCPKELWNDRFDKIKAAGFNTVETYVAWNKEEAQMPASPEDYSKIDLKDLEDWLTMAEAHGLYVILRPGPYICAEWDCGGFPQWLITKRPIDYGNHMWLRSDEPSFVAWSKHWFHAVDQVVVKHQLTHRQPGTGGIILYQLENEYGGNQPDAVEVNYLRALAQQATGDGIDVPLFTCWTGVVRGSRDPILRQVYDSCNFYPRFGVKEELDREITKLQKQQPDAPLQTTELQGGWFSKPGDAGSLSQSWTDVIDSLSPAQIQNLTLYAIEKGDRVTNYYMLFGGTNFGDFAPQGITTSYDYSAPIREIGAVGDKYQRVAAIGAMLKEHGEQIARAYSIKCEAKTDQSDVTVTGRLAENGNLYLFVRTNQHTEPRKGKAVCQLSQGSAGVVNGKAVDKFEAEISFNYDLEPFGSKIYLVKLYETEADGQHKAIPLQTGEWLPKPVAEIKRPTDGLPASIKLMQALTKPDPGPEKWEPLTDAQSLEQMGIYDRRFVFYRVHLNISADKPAPMLSIEGPHRDSLLSFVNGDLEPSLNRPGGQPLTKLHAGENTVEMLYENVGQPNGGIGMEEMSGIRKIESLMNAADVHDWRMTKITPPANKFRPARLDEIKPDFDDSKWKPIEIKSDEDAAQLDENEYGVFRGSVDITADQLKAGDLNLQVSRMDDSGSVFINGKPIGDGRNWETSFTFPAKGLHEGKNSIAIVVKNEGGKGGLGMVRLLIKDPSSAAVPIEIGTASTGFAQQWWNPSADQTGWTPQPIDKEQRPIDHLNWSRLNFDLPEKKPGIWVPWVARLHIVGNGFLYLNGHALGRYWNVGPQHDFFLPECWLNFGQANVLTTCLRSVDGKPIKIESAEIVPVNEVAEFR